MKQENSTAVAKREPGKITYQVAGQDVTLSYQIVRDFLTKGNGSVNDQDLTQFISICKYNQLNPFLNEAYLVKFGNAPAQMIVSKEAYMKRADACEEYEGIRAGVIVLRDGEAVELEGAFYLSNDKLVGGWAHVYRKDRKFPIVAKVNLSEYDKKQSVWNEKPSTMISKVAKVQALREAFPAQLGAMYTHEESQIEDAEYIDVSTKVEEEVKTEANKSGTLSFENEGKPEEAKTEVNKEPAQPKAESQTQPETQRKRGF